VKLTQLVGDHFWYDDRAEQALEHRLQAGFHQRCESGGVTDDDHGSGGQRWLFGKQPAQGLQVAFEIRFVIRHRNAALAEKLHELRLGKSERVPSLSQRQPAIHEQADREAKEQLLRTAPGLHGE